MGNHHCGYRLSGRFSAVNLQRCTSASALIGLSLRDFRPVAVAGVPMTSATISGHHITRQGVDKRRFLS